MAFDLDSRTPSLGLYNRFTPTFSLMTDGTSIVVDSRVCGAVSPNMIYRLNVCNFVIDSHSLSVGSEQ